MVADSAEVVDYFEAPVKTPRTHSLHFCTGNWNFGDYLSNMQTECTVVKVTECTVVKVTECTVVKVQAGFLALESHPARAA